MRSSNQQSYSVSLRSKRDNFRNQIRREQLQQIFKAKRLELMQGRQQDERFHMYKRLQESIENCPNNMETMDILMKEIKDLCEKFPLEKKNFFLIGSFLLKRQDKVFQFQDYIMREENFTLSNVIQFSWCFGIYCSIMCSLMQNSSIKNCEHQLLRIDEFLSILIKNYWQSFKLSQHNVDIMQIYSICLEQFFHHFENKHFFPIRSFISLTNCLNQFYSVITEQGIINVREVKLTLTRLINRSIMQIKEKELYSNEIRQFLTQQQVKYLIPTGNMEKLIQVSAEIFYQNFVDVSDQKIQCVLSIRILCQCSPINAGQFLFEKKYMKNYQYLMKHQFTVLGDALLHSINIILPHVTNSRLIQFLDLKFHLNLIQVLRENLIPLFRKHTKKDGRIHSETIFYILMIFQTLLLKVDELDNKVFKRVFMTMSSHGFDDLIQQMGEVRFQDKIEEVWSNIVDTYFSQDVCDENHQKQTHNNLMNSQFSYQSQRKENIFSNSQRNYYENNNRQDRDHHYGQFTV